VALRKRSVDPDRVERLISGIVRRLEQSGEQEVRSEALGEMVMEALKGLDDVAYVRFASVYRDFREARDFQSLIGELGRGDGPAAIDEDETTPDEPSS
jgi:transcriptional repressor NrdR